MPIRNPYRPNFKLNSDGATYSANPDYCAFAGLKTDRERAEFLARRKLDLPPAADLPALSAIYPNRKSHVNDPMRYARLLSDNGRFLVDLAYKRAMDESLDDAVRQDWWDRFWRACRYPNAASVNEGGQTEGEVAERTVWGILQEARRRQALQEGQGGTTVDGEARELPIGREQNGDSGSDS